MQFSGLDDRQQTVNNLEMDKKAICSSKSANRDRFLVSLSIDFFYYIKLRDSPLLHVEKKAKSSACGRLVIVSISPERMFLMVKVCSLQSR